MIELYHLNQRLTMTDPSAQQAAHIKTYPTRSLREYLAHRSVHYTENEEQRMESALDIELDIGDGRKETLTVSASTNISFQAQQFCRKHKLEPYVQQLLVESIRDLYAKESTERQNQREAQIAEQLHQISSNSRAFEVLMRDSPQRKPSFPPEADTETYESNIKASLTKNTGSSEEPNKQNKPAMNSLSRLICDRYGKQNIIQSRNRRSKQRLEALRREKVEREALDLAQCHFQPKINTISQKVDQELKQSRTRHDKKQQRYEVLYQNYQEVEQKKHQLLQKAQAELPFKPSINFISKKIVEGRRIMPQHNHLQSSHRHCQHQQHSNRPKTGRKPATRNTAGLPIGQYLYQQSRRNSKPQPQLTHEIKALQHSDFLVSVLKEKKLKEIFGELSQPPHSQITPDDIPPYQDLVHTTLRLMYPLLSEIQSMGISLSQEDFVESGLSLIDTLTPDEKHELISRKVVDRMEMSYQSSQSKLFLRQSSGDLYARGIERNRQRQGRLQQSRQAKVREELKGCTFRPVLHR